MALSTLWSFRQNLKYIIEQEGSQKDYAQKVGVSEQYLSDVINGKRRPGKKLLRGMGWERITLYGTENNVNRLGLTEGDKW